MLVPSVELVVNKLHRSIPPRAFNSNALHSDLVPYAMHCAAQSAPLPTIAILCNTKLEAAFNRTPTRAPLKWSNESVGQGTSAAVVVVGVVGVGVAAVVCCVASPPSHFRLKLPVPFTSPPASLQAAVAMHCPFKSARMFLHFEHTLPRHVWQLVGHVQGCGGEPSVDFPTHTRGCSPPPPSFTPSCSSPNPPSRTHFLLKLPPPLTVPLIVMPSQTLLSIQLPANNDRAFLQTLHWPLAT